MQRTDEQEAIITGVARSSDSLMIEAGAGCGKSSTLEMAAPGVQIPALALAFNKSIATELGKRLPANFQVKTLNGLGHGAWMRGNPQVTKWTLDEKKTGKAVTQMARDRRLDLISDQWDQCRSLVSRAMMAGLVPKGSGPEGLVPDDHDGWLSVSNGMSSDDFDYLWELAREVLVWNIAAARAGTISFDDQIYCSTMLGGRFAQFPVVFVDESQDLSALNHIMLAKSTRADGRMVAVGDSRQAIYAFRGADSDSMANMRGLRAKWTDLPLMTTFRCPKTVVERQRHHVPLFRAFEGNPEGRVSRIPFESDRSDTNPDPGWTWKQIDEIARPLGPVAVLCRNNAPLLSLAFKLIRGQVGVRMLGRDLGKGLVQLSRKLAPDDATPADTVRGLVNDWAQRESSLARANGHEEKLDGISDRAESLLATLESTECHSAGELRTLLTRLFAREDGQVTLASGHKSKGLEWAVVVHLDPWRLPSKQATRALIAGDPRPMEQEHNLRYVIETRTRHTLLMADLTDFEGTV